jgi:hypothetical protein
LNKKYWIWRILIGIVVLAVLAGVGFAVYRLGFAHGLMASNGWEGFSSTFEGHSGFLKQRFDAGGLPARGGMRPMRFFSPFTLLFRLAIVVGGVWLLVKLFRNPIRGNGWQLTFSKAPVVETVEPVQQSAEEEFADSNS